MLVEGRQRRKQRPCFAQDAERMRTEYIKRLAVDGDGFVEFMREFKYFGSIIYSELTIQTPISTSASSRRRQYSGRSGWLQAVSLEPAAAMLFRSPGSAFRRPAPTDPRFTLRPILEFSYLLAARSMVGSGISRTAMGLLNHSLFSVVMSAAPPPPPRQFTARMPVTYR